VQLPVKFYLRRVVSELVHSFFWRDTVFAVPLVFFALEHDAAASGPVDVAVALRTGFASPIGAEDNPFGPGVGGRAGVTFRNAYVGASIMYYAGVYVSPGEGFNAQGVQGVHTFLYGAELGYGFVVVGARDPSYDPFLTPWLETPKEPHWVVAVRPQLGIGYRVTYYTGDTSFGDDPGQFNQRGLYLEPAIVGEAKWGMLLLAADVGVVVSPGMQDDFDRSAPAAPSFTFQAVVGLVF
jgi:hypothetical protein